MRVPRRFPRQGGDRREEARAERDALRALPAEGDQIDWVLFGSVDIGLIGMIFDGMDTKRSALARTDDAVSAAAPRALAKFVGVAGFSTAAASYAFDVASPISGIRTSGSTPTAICWRWWWIDGRRSQNLDRDSGVPSVGALFLGASSDLSARWVFRRLT